MDYNALIREAVDDAVKRERQRAELILKRAIVNLPDDLIEGIRNQKGALALYQRQWAITELTKGRTQ